MEDAYEILLRNKAKSESFSQLIRRTMKRKKDIMEFAGAWKDLTGKEAGEMKSNITKLRKRSTRELMEKHK